jgi:putative PEP-CTERM system TPR-repeat lipoprotein
METGMTGFFGRGACVLIATGTLLAGCEFATSPEKRMARAEQALASGDTGAAVVDLKNVLQKDASNAWARLLLARAELARGDAGAAQSDFDKVTAAAVSAADYESMRWRLAFARGRYDDVVAGLAAKNANLPDGERLALLGRAYAALGRTAEARDTLDQAVAADPRNGEAAAALGLAIAAAGDVRAARARLEQAAKTFPGDVAVQRALGDLALRDGRSADAEAAFRAALSKASPQRGIVDYLGASAGLAEALFAQQKIDEVAKVSADVNKAAPGSALALLLTSRVAAAQKNYDAAIAALQKLLNADPDNPQFATMMAALQMEQGSMEQAAVNLQRVIATHPEATPARRLLAQVQLAQGRADAADATLAAAPAEGVGGAEAMLLRARAALAAGNSARAVELLEQLAKQGVPTEALRLDLAATFLQAGRADRALELLDASAGGGAGGDRAEQLRLVALASKDRAAAVNGLKDYGARHGGDERGATFAALTLAALGDADASRAMLAQLAQALPKAAGPRLNLARVEARVGRFEAAEAALQDAAKLDPGAQPRLALAQLAALRGRDDDAIRWLEEARARDAKSVEALTLLARAYVARGELPKARTVADELLALQPTSAEARLVSAAIALRQKDAARAQKDAAEAVRLAPESAAAWLGNGEVQEQTGRVDAARDAYRRAATLAPKSPLPEAAVARLELGAGRGESALEAARRARAQPGSEAAGLRLEGEVLMRLNRPADAARSFERLLAVEPSVAAAVATYRARAAAGIANPQAPLQRWLETHPQDIAARASLAEHWQRVGQPDRAIAEYEAALKQQPNQPLLLNNLAWLYHEKNDARALDLARRAHELAPRNAAIADTLGVVLVSRDALDEAIPLLREAANGSAGTAEIQYHLADALRRKGNAAEARQVAQRVLADPKAGEDLRRKAEALTR